jgi:hypothetical protein
MRDRRQELRSTTPDKPKPTRWQRLALLVLPVILGFVPVALAAILAISAQITIYSNRERLMSTIAPYISDRVDAPELLPAALTDRGFVTIEWRKGELAQLDWDAWHYSGAAGETVTFFVTSITPDVIPILALYRNGARIARTETLTRLEQTITYTFPAAQEIIMLVSSVGGAPGKYEVRCQKTS